MVSPACWCWMRSTPNSYSMLSFIVRMLATVLPTRSRKLSAGPRNSAGVWAARDGGKRAAHGCDVTDRPDLVEDKGHDHQRQQNADEAVAGGGEFGRSGEAREDHQVKGEGSLHPNEVELASADHPGGEKGNCGGQ